CISSLNPIAEAMTGWTHAEAQGRALEEVFAVFDTDTGVALRNPLREAIGRNTIVDITGHSVLRHRHGFDTPVEDSCAPIHDHAGKVIGGVLVFHDISEHRTLALKMLHLTQHDALTGLPNRSQLQSRIQLAMTAAERRQQRCALLYIDVANFKLVNELYGHANGDRVLRALVAQLRKGLPGDELLIRHGSDEFVVALPHVESAGDAAVVCQRLLLLSTQTALPDLPELALRVSVGVSLFPDDASDAELLLQHAEAAQRAAKAGHHGYRFFSKSMDERALELRQIEAALRTALAREELALYYQPKVDAQSLRIVGAEALMRWHVHGRQRYAPDDFIPVAEDTALILPIGTWALHEACRQVKRWQQAGRVLSLSVNVSPVQFQHPDFYRELTNALDTTGADPDCLELEVTERMVMSGGDATTSLLRRIRRTGVRLSLDDFGTGYCSLSYLRRFPIDALKIDRAFVHELTTDADTAAITQAIITMARSLNKEVIAEGVETQAQATFLRNAGCSQLQGFLYSAAVSAPAFDALLDKQG
ncbi:MAG: EAL domain-containing protein, partial [Rhodanobacter sp.]